MSENDIRRDKFLSILIINDNYIKWNFLLEEKFLGLILNWMDQIFKCHNDDNKIQSLIRKSNELNNRIRFARMNTSHAFKAVNIKYIKKVDQYYNQDFRS